MLSDKQSMSASDALKKLNENKSAVDSLKNSKEGLAARDFADKNGEKLRLAMENGDSAELSRLLSSFLSTDAGEKLASRLSEIIK